jgi:hypothetical protein
MKDWSDLPIRFDRPARCERCGSITLHTVTEYKDEEIRTCTRCKTRTIIKFDEGAETGREARTPDTGKEEADFKRAAKRKYRPRKRDEEDEED